MDDIEPCADEVVHVTAGDVDWEVWRALVGIPRGFPLWYVPERLALPIGPIGRALMDGHRIPLALMAEQARREWDSRPDPWALLTEDPFDPSAWLNLEWDRTLPELEWEISIGSWFLPAAIPAGFPSFYCPELPALTVGPIGRYMQQTQCRCGHDELQHIILLDECLAGCDCPRYVPRTPPVPMGWHERLVRAIRDAWGWM